MAEQTSTSSLSTFNGLTTLAQQVLGNTGSSENTDINKIINTGSGVVSGAAAGTSIMPGIGTIIGGIIGGLSSFFGFSKDNRAKNLEEDRGHWTNIVNQYYTDLQAGDVIASGPYPVNKDEIVALRQQLSDEEIKALKDAALAAVNQNPYALEQKYAPGSIGGFVTEYITAREASNKTLAVQTEQTGLIQSAINALNQGKQIESNVAQASNTAGIIQLNNKTILTAVGIVAVALAVFLYLKKKG